MRVNFPRRFFSKTIALLATFAVNYRIVLCSVGLEESKPCESMNKSACVILCKNWNFDSKPGGLKKILQAEEKKFETCTLILEGCQTSNATWHGINPDDNPRVEDLKIVDSLIDLNQMSLESFKSLRSLTMKNTSTANLRVEPFRQLPKLQKLQVKSNGFLTWVEKGFLQSLSLDSLKIQELNLNQFETIQFFKNLTSGGEIPTILELDWSHNNIGIFPLDLLSHFPNLNLLILTNSSIYEFENETCIKANIKSVFIDQNKIQKLPEKIFRPLIEKASFVSIEGNNLICDCKMKWLQTFFKRQKYSENFKSFCAHPKSVEFSKIEMCSEKKSNTEEPANICCTSQKNFEYNLQMKTMRFVPTFENAPRKFSIKNEEPEFIEITISDTVDMEKVFFYYIDYANITSPKYNCLKILQSKLSISAIPETDYLMCLAKTIQQNQIDIFECLPFRTKPLFENQPWLTNKSIPLSIISIFFAFLFALAMGALILYLSVRENPSLIRGSKRVIEVKRHDKAQVLIMPRDYESVSQTDSSSALLMNPRLPLDPCLSSLSSDTISTVSYVSVNQPTQLEIMNYRFNRLRELFQRNNNLPVPRQIAAPWNRRLPPDVDLLIEYERYTITTTTTEKV